MEERYTNIPRTKKAILHWLKNTSPYHSFAPYLFIYLQKYIKDCLSSCFEYFSGIFMSIPGIKRKLLTSLIIFVLQSPRLISICSLLVKVCVCRILDNPENHAISRYRYCLRQPLCSLKNWWDDFTVTLINVRKKFACTLISDQNNRFLVNRRFRSVLGLREEIF